MLYVFVSGWCHLQLLTTFFCMPANLFTIVIFAYAFDCLAICVIKDICIYCFLLTSYDRFITWKKAKIMICVSLQPLDVIFCFIQLLRSHGQDLFFNNYKINVDGYAWLIHLHKLFCNVLFISSFNKCSLLLNWSMHMWFALV